MTACISTANSLWTNLRSGGPWHMPCRGPEPRALCSYAGTREEYGAAHAAGASQHSTASHTLTAASEGSPAPLSASPTRHALWRSFPLGWGFAKLETGNTTHRRRRRTDGAVRTRWIQLQHTTRAVEGLKLALVQLFRPCSMLHDGELVDALDGDRKSMTWHLRTVRCCATSVGRAGVAER